LYEVGNKSFAFNKHIHSNEAYHHSFSLLAQKTFGLHFQNWTDKYIPHVLLDGENVVSNVSVNIIDTMWKGTLKRYIQLGTVMTDNAYRNMGLSRFLINRIFADWLSNCDAMYLYANDTVLDFYPRFGFVKEEEYQSSMPITHTHKNVKARILNMSNKADVELLHKFYHKSNPFSALPMLDNFGLLMFYCSASMKDCVYYIEEYSAIVIAKQNDETLICYDIFCDKGFSMASILSHVVCKGCKNVLFGFAVENAEDSALTLVQVEDTTLFVLQSKENIFADNKTMFPLLSHA